MRTRIKICGLTRARDVRAAVAAGADAIGLVFYPPSPRYVAPRRALEVVRDIPPFITVVGVFCDADKAAVREAIDTVPLDLLQFHGSESAEYCRGWPQPYLKGIAMRDNVDVRVEAARFADARGILVDSAVAGAAGGTGATFDWRRLADICDVPLVLAGGLTVENVATAIRTVRPYGVDVSSGVESEKGIKDQRKIERFVCAVRSADEGGTE